MIVTNKTIAGPPPPADAVPVDLTGRSEEEIRELLGEDRYRMHREFQEVKARSDRAWNNVVALQAEWVDWFEIVKASRPPKPRSLWRRFLLWLSGSN